MIKIVITDYPDKHKVKIEDIDNAVSCPPSDCIFETSITHNGSQPNNLSPDACWDIDVTLLLGGWRIRLPKLCREGVSTRDMLYELMLADNGTATDWVRTLLGDPDANGLWDRYHREHP